MPYPQFDRHKLFVKPLSARKDKVYIERDQVLPTAPPAHPFSETGQKAVDETIIEIKKENPEFGVFNGAVHVHRDDLFCEITVIRRRHQLVLRNKKRYGNVGIRNTMVRNHKRSKILHH